MIASALLVEDERGVRDLVRRYLERDGLSVVAVATGAEALNSLEDHSFDVVVLDLGLPDVDGEEVLASATGRDLPVVVLTARGRLPDRIRGLELGAADYLGKPFSPRELVLRVRAVLHRTDVPVPLHDSTVSLGGGHLVIDQVRHEACLDDQLVLLTPTEWDLLLALATSPGRAFSRYELATRLRGYGFEGYERTVDSHVKNLRHKLGESAHTASIIETVSGVGYRLGLARDR